MQARFGDVIKTIDLRDYQKDSIELLSKRMREGQRRQILCAPTGAGKTVIAAEIMRRVKERGKRALFLCDRIALVDQTSDALRSYGIEHGVVQGESRLDRGASAQVVIASMQTLERRNFWPDAALVIVDEAHTARKAVRSFVMETEAQVIGLTATPFTAGLANVYEGIVNTATTNALIGEGWLAPLRIYQGRAADMADAPTNAMGEWTSTTAAERGQAVIGDIVSEWRRRTREHFGGPVKTLLFSATVAHGEELCGEFQRAGYDFRQISYLDRDLAERREVISEFRKGNIDGLVSVEALAKGFDVPDVQCLVSARAYRKSLAAHLQQLGRGMRPYPNKEFCLVLDHSGNCAGFAQEMANFFEYGINSLRKVEERASVERKEGDLAKRDAPTCVCGMLFAPDDDVCLGCGAARPRRQSTVRTIPGSTVELTLKPQKPHDYAERWADRKQWVWDQMMLVADWRKRGDPSALRLARAQYKQLFDEWPARRWGEAPPFNMEMDIEVQALVDWQISEYVARKRRER